MRGSGATRVIADQHIPDKLVAAALLATADEDISLTSVNRLEWEGVENGKLHERAKKRGCDVIFTYDKAMANETVPLVPVLVLDALEESKMPVAARVLVDVLLAEKYEGVDYYPVAMPWAEPSIGLRQLAAGLYAQNPRHRFAAGGYLQAHWDDRRLGPPDTSQYESTRSRMWYRRVNGLTLTGQPRGRSRQ